MKKFNDIIGKHFQTRHYFATLTVSSKKAKMYELLTVNSTSAAIVSDIVGQYNQTNRRHYFRSDIHILEWGLKSSQA